MILKPSPNFDARPDGTVIDHVILHYTGMTSGAAAIARLCDDSAAARAAGRVSAHYVVEEDGRVFKLVDESARAWHAGVSYWRRRTGLNDCAIGIEIVNPGHEFGYRPFPALQMEAVLGLLQGIVARHAAIRPFNIVAHSDVAPTRKVDPGELFDWAWLARHGLGLWPTPTPADEAAGQVLLEKPSDFYAGLRTLGYQTDAPDSALARAFHLHFAGSADSAPTPKSAAQLAWLLRQPLP